MNNIGLLTSLVSGINNAGRQVAESDENSCDFESFFNDFKASLEQKENIKTVAEETDGEMRDINISGDVVILPETENSFLSNKHVFSEEDAAASLAALILIMTNGAKLPAEEQEAIPEKTSSLALTDEPLSDDTDELPAIFSDNAKLKTFFHDNNDKVQALFEEIKSLPESETKEEKPKTILSLLAEYIEVKRKEKSEKEAEKNIVEKLSESASNAEHNEQLEKNTVVATDIDIIKSVLSETELINELSSDDGITKLAALIYEFIENIKSGTSEAETGEKSLFAKAVSSVVSNEASALPKKTALLTEQNTRENAKQAQDKIAPAKNSNFAENISADAKPETKQFTEEKISQISATVKNDVKIDSGVEVKESFRAESAEKVSPAPKNPEFQEQDGKSFLDNMTDNGGKKKHSFQTAQIGKETAFNVFIKEASGNSPSEIKQEVASQQTYDLKDAKDITRLVKTLESTANKGESKLTVTLTPENLGRLEIRLVESGGKITAKFFTDNESSHKMMLSQGEAIKAQLNDKGIVIDNMEFAFTDTASRQGAGEERRTGKHSGNKKAFKQADNQGEVGNEIANIKENGIYA